MKRIFLTLAASALIAGASMTAQAAQAPELHITPTQIGATVKQQPDRFKKLTDRFVAADSTLTLEEVATVYYGSAYSPSFTSSNAYAAVEDAYKSGDYAKALQLIDAALATDPANLGLLFKGFGAATSLSDAARAANYQRRLAGVCDVIFNSGMGVTDVSPYVVVRPSDRDEFIAKYLQPVSISGSATLGDIDAVKMKIDGVADEVILYFKPFTPKN